MFNKVILIGNLTRDSEIKYLPSGLAVSNFSIAVNSKFGEKEEVLFMENVLFGKLAESINDYMKKGTKILVEGRLQEQTWEGKDGEQKRKTITIASNVRLLSDKKSNIDSNKSSRKADYDPF